MCAGDTFPAAAADQPEIWLTPADPAAVVFDGIQATKSRNADVILRDTAGAGSIPRRNLMNESSKISGSSTGAASMRMAVVRSRWC